jgi:nicotinamidase-related amidase
MIPFLTHASFIEKTAFSCVDEPKFNSKLIETRDQIILAGMESHICILQTALDLIDQGKKSIHLRRCHSIKKYFK